jgi:hypothetical protein
MEHTNNSISTKHEIPDNMNKSYKIFKILIISLIFSIYYNNWLINWNNNISSKKRGKK